MSSFVGDVWIKRFFLFFCFLFSRRGSLFDVGVGFVVCWLVVVRFALSVVIGLSFDVCCLLLFVSCYFSLPFVRWPLFGVCRLPFVVCSLLVVRLCFCRLLYLWFVACCN